jgi:Mg2+/Co2+ transporter CorC
MLTQIGEGIEELPYAQMDTATVQANMATIHTEMTAAHDRFSTIHNHTGNVLSILFQQMQHNHGK